MSKIRSKKIPSLGSQLSTIISVSLVLLIIGLILTASSITTGANNSLRENVGLTLRMMPDATDAQIDSLAQIIQAMPSTSSMRYTSPEDVLQMELEYNADVLEVLGENPFSPEFEIYVKSAYANSASLADIAVSLQSIDCVDTLFYSTEVIDNINLFLKKATLYLSILGGIMAIISIVLIFNTVNLVIYGRRFTIHTMKLVGATPAFIRAPFIKSGLLIGILAGVIASGIICALHAYTIREGLDAVIFTDWTHTALLCGILIVIGAAFCSLSAYIAANKYIHYTQDQLYKK